LRVVSVGMPFQHQAVLSAKHLEVMHPAAELGPDTRFQLLDFASVAEASACFASQAVHDFTKGLLRVNETPNAAPGPPWRSTVMSFGAVTPMWTWLPLTATTVVVTSPSIFRSAFFVPSVSRSSFVTVHTSLWLR